MSEDFEEHGQTAGCPGCIWLQTQIGPRRGHTEQCRKRMEEELAKTEAGQQRLEADKEKLLAGVGDVVGLVDRTDHSPVLLVGDWQKLPFVRLLELYFQASWCAVWLIPTQSWRRLPELSLPRQDAGCEHSQIQSWGRSGTYRS